MMRKFAWLLMLAGLSGAVERSLAYGDEPPSVPAEANRPRSKDPPGMTRLMPEYDVWIDAASKRVVLDGTICLREGQLEMLACPRGTKEHESIISADTKAYPVHAALLAIGAISGTPAKFQPTYAPATGQQIDIEVVWSDKDGTTKRAKAQDWIKNIKTNQAMEYPWVFAGSGFWTDELTGQQRYMAESGDFICVSNFPTATMDLPVESSQSNDALLFVAFTERIPAVGTRVRLVLTPKLGR